MAVCPMDRCADCGALLRDAVVLCRGCGRELPLRVVVVSEGSRGGGFALVVEARPDGERHPAEISSDEEEEHDG